MKQKFVQLTYDILKLEDLTSTDKIVLARRVGFGKMPYYEKVATMASVLNMGVKTVEKSITKLKRLGHWPVQCNPTGVGAKPTRGGSVPTRVGANPTGVGNHPTLVGDKKSFSPLKTDLLVDNSLDKILEKKDKIVGLNDSPPTVLKKINSENSVPIKTQEIKINGVSESEAPIQNGHPRVQLTAPPLGPDGKPLRDVDMVSANFKAWSAGQPDPFTKAQVASATCWAQHAPSVADEHYFDDLMDKFSPKGSHPKPTEIGDEFSDLFEKKAG